MYIKKYVRKNISAILHILATAILCAIFMYGFEVNSDYIFFINLVLGICIVAVLFQIIFKRRSSGTLHKILCIITVGIFANRLYSYRQWVILFPGIEAVGSRALLWYGLLGIAGITVVFAIIRLLAPIKGLRSGEAVGIGEMPHSQKSGQVIDETRQEEILNVDIQSATPYVPGNHAYGDKPLHRESKDLSFFRMVGILFFITLILIGTILLYNFFVVSGTSDKKVNFLDTVTALASYGAGLISVIIALAVIIMILIGIVKVIIKQISKFKAAGEEKSSNSESVPLYLISVFIVLVIFVVSYKVTGFTMNDFTEIAFKGDYLALPLMLVLAMAAFLIFVLLVHGIILWLSGITTQKVKSFMKESYKAKEQAMTVVQVVEGLVGVVLNTISNALEFVKFIPEFFSSLSGMILDDESEGEDKNGQK